MDSYFFILTTIDLFVLGFMCFLTKLSESLNKKQKRGFFLAFALIAAISVLEVVTLVVDGAPPGYRWLNILSNYLGFGLSQRWRCALCMSWTGKIIRRGFKAAVCCEGGYLLFLAATLPGCRVLGECGKTSTPGVGTFSFMSSCITPPCCTLWWLRCARQLPFRIAAAR